MSVRSVRDTEDISRGPNFFLIGLLDENGGNAEEIIFKEIIGICRIFATNVRQLDFHSCFYIQFVVISCFTEVQEENPASHRYVVGMGRVVQ